MRKHLVGFITAIVFTTALVAAQVASLINTPYPTMINMSSGGVAGIGNTFNTQNMNGHNCGIDAGGTWTGTMNVLLAGKSGVFYPANTYVSGNPATITANGIYAVSAAGILQIEIQGVAGGTGNAAISIFCSAGTSALVTNGSGGGGSATPSPGPSPIPGPTAPAGGTAPNTGSFGFNGIICYNYPSSALPLNVDNTMNWVACGPGGSFGAYIVGGSASIIGGYIGVNPQATVRLDGSSPTTCTALLAAPGYIEGITNGSVSAIQPTLHFYNDAACATEMFAVTLAPGIRINYATSLFNVGVYYTLSGAASSEILIDTAAK